MISAIFLQFLRSDFERKSRLSYKEQRKIKEDLAGSACTIIRDCTTQLSIITNSLGDLVYIALPGFTAMLFRNNGNIQCIEGKGLWGGREGVATVELSMERCG